MSAVFSHWNWKSWFCIVFYSTFGLWAIFENVFVGVFFSCFCKHFIVISTSCVGNILGHVLVMEEEKLDFLFLGFKNALCKIMQILAKNSVWCSGGSWMEPKCSPDDCSFFLYKKLLKSYEIIVNNKVRRGSLTSFFLTQDTVFICLAKKCGFSQPMVLPQPNWGFRESRTVFLRFLGPFF